VHSRDNKSLLEKLNAFLPNNMAQFTCAAIAGTISQSIFYPTSTALTRIQVHTSPIRTFDDGMNVIFRDVRGKGFLSCWSSLYYGFLSAGSYKILTRSVKYGGQPSAARQLEHWCGPQARDYLGEKQSKALLEALAGGCIGISEVILFHWLDTIRIKRQSGDHTSFWKHLNDPVKLYNGSVITMTRNFVSFSVLFGVSSMLMSMMGLGSAREANLGQRFSSASVAAGVSVLATNPLDVTKTRIQSAANRVSALSMFRQIVSNEGVLALYKGVTLKILSALPKKALPLALSGYLLDLWEKRQADQPQKSKTLK
jgi:hypothetical protein